MAWEVVVVRRILAVFGLRHIMCVSGKRTTLVPERKIRAVTKPLSALLHT